MRILFFAPHAAIWYTSFPEALIADSLARGGNDIIYLTCGRALGEFCIPMAAGGLSARTPASRKHEICHTCSRYGLLLRSRFDFKGPELSELIDSSIEQRTSGLLAGLSQETAIDLVVDDIPVGRIALYNVVNRHKKIELNLTDSEWLEYQIELKNVINICQAVGRFIDGVRPDRVVVTNALYPANRVVCALAEKRGIPSYFLHAGGNFSRRLQALLVGRGDAFSFYENILRHWPRFAGTPCNSDDLSQVTDHYLHLFRGKSVFGYSSASQGNANIREQLGISSRQRIVLATMSSTDELFSAQFSGVQATIIPFGSSVFSNQIDWIRATVDYISRRPDLFLIIRVHPREFPNRRERIASEHGRLLRELLVDLPGNVRVNWPEDELSLYDLARETDVVLNAWSSAGKELGILGIPVVLYGTENMVYPPDLCEVASSPEDYFEKLEAALENGWSFERSRGLFRWGVFEFKRCLIDIGDSYHTLENPDRSLFERALGRLRRSIDPDSEQRRDIRRRRSAMAADRTLSRLFESGDRTIVDSMLVPRTTADDLDQETAAISRELRRLAEALFPDVEDRNRSRLFRRMTADPAGLGGHALADKVAAVEP